MVWKYIQYIPKVCVSKLLVCHQDLNKKCHLNFNVVNFTSSFSVETQSQYIFNQNKIQNTFLTNLLISDAPIKNFGIKLIVLMLWMITTTEII